MKRTRKRRRRRSKLRGGFGMDTRSSFFPGPISDLANSLQYSMSQTNANWTGSYPSVDPNWRIQPLR